MKMRSIIVVEREPTILMFIVDFLEQDGYAVKAFNEADSAWSHIEKHGLNANLLITNLRMPSKISGLQLVQNLHNLFPQIPVVVASGFNAAFSGLDGSQVHWLPKPFTLEQLQGLCHKLIPGS